jgi:hypothetical protein
LPGLRSVVEERLAGREALAMQLSSGQLHEAAGQLHAILGQVHAIAAQVHAPAERVGWFSYGGAGRVVIAVVLVAVAAGVAAVGARLRVPVRLPAPGRTARTVMLATWGTAIVSYLVCFGIYLHQLLHQHLIHSRPAQPVFPITAACMIALFFGILYIGRSLSEEARLGSAFIGAVAAPMIFEFPFDLMVMTRTYPAIAPDPALYRVLFFAPLFLVEFTTLALLSLSPLVRLSRMAFFAFALMLLIFAVWALFGLGYPSAPLPFAFNAVSKVVAFVAALCLFLPQRGRASAPARRVSADGGSAETCRPRATHARTGR